MPLLRTVIYNGVRVVVCVVVILYWSHTFILTRRLEARHPGVKIASVSIFKKITLFLVIFVLGVVLDTADR